LKNFLSAAADPPTSPVCIVQQAPPPPGTLASSCTQSVASCGQTRVRPTVLCVASFEQHRERRAVASAVAFDHCSVFVYKRGRVSVVGFRASCVALHPLLLRTSEELSRKVAVVPLTVHPAPVMPGHTSSECPHASYNRPLQGCSDPKYCNMKSKTSDFFVSKKLEKMCKFSSSHKQRHMSGLPV